MHAYGPDFGEPYYKIISTLHFYFPWDISSQIARQYEVGILDPSNILQQKIIKLPCLQTPLWRMSLGAILR